MGPGFYFIHAILIPQKTILQAIFLKEFQKKLDQLVGNTSW